jgi:hypothetical protein
MAIVEPSKSRGIVDGTTATLHCGIHDFRTEDLGVWEQHLAQEKGHYDVGYTKCNLCGKTYHFTAEDKVPSIMVRKGLATHPECYKRVTEGN